MAITQQATTGSRSNETEMNIKATYSLLYGPNFTFTITNKRTARSLARDCEAT